MKLFRNAAKLSILGLFFTCLGLHAQELTVLGGFTSKENFGKFSGTWQIDYRQYFLRNFAGSIVYVNEGHLLGHHRDGNAMEFWARLPMYHDKISISLGAGAYYYYDTQPVSGSDTINVHGTAPIYSFAATGYFSDRVFCRFMINRINPAHDITVTTAAVGLGVWFGRDKKPTAGELGDAPEEKSYVTENEFVFFGGQSVVNSLFNNKARAYAVEYRRGLSSHIDGTASLIYEGDPKIVRRSGFATQVWAVNTFFDERISLGIGAGPYIYIDRKRPVAEKSWNPAAIAPIVSLTFAVRLSEHWLTRFTWDRVISTYNRDADVFLVGFGYRWSKNVL